MILSAALILICLANIGTLLLIRRIATTLATQQRRQHQRHRMRRKSRQRRINLAS